MNDREVLRRLAGRVAEIAHLDAQRERAELYRALNRLQPIRPVVLIDEIPWNQLPLPELRLICEGAWERAIEQRLRRLLYRWDHAQGDMIVPGEYAHPRHIALGSFGVTVQERTLAIDEGNNIVSHAFEDQLPDDESLNRLREPEISLDEDADAADLERLNALFGDLLPIRLAGMGYFGSFAPWDDISYWRGVEPLLWDLVDEPDRMHRLMRRLTDIRLSLLARAEAMNLLEPTGTLIHCTAGLADEIPGPIEGGRITRRNLWGRGTAQIFASVSAAMHDEFDITYAKRFFEGFGLLYYGCCEPLDRKIDILRKLPNLRKISITPWADADRGAEAIGRDYVMAFKPNPAFLAVDVLDETAIRAELRRALAASRRNGTPIEFTLKDISSIGHRPGHLDRWAQIAMEEALS